MCGENIGFFIIKQIKKIPLCSVEQLGHGEKHSTFPYTSFMLYNFLRALQQNRNTSGNLVGGEILWEHNSPKLQTSMLGFL